MRWDGQRIDGDRQDALPGFDGYLRSVRTPDFSGVVFHEVRAKSVLNRVSGESGVPFRWTVNPYRGCSHGCRYCLGADTPILLANGRTRPISELRVGDEIYGTRQAGDERCYAATMVLAHWSTVKPAYRVSLEDGTELIASAAHRLLTEQGWRQVASQGGTRIAPPLNVGNRLMGSGHFADAPIQTPAYRRGYLCGMLGYRTCLRDDDCASPENYSFHVLPTDMEALERAEEYLAGEAMNDTLLEWPTVPCAAWSRGFLAGIFDVEGSYSQGALRIASADPAITNAIKLALKRFDFRYLIEDCPETDGLRKFQLLGGLAEQLRFFHTVDPAVTYKRTIDDMIIAAPEWLGVVAVEPLGLELPMFDITTGTGDFIAHGVVNHNCFARNSHTYLDFDAGRDFDTQIVVKVNAPEVLATQLRKPSWTREHVAMGTNTDPYQRAEGRYALMPGIIKALAKYGTPFSILTKGTVLSRDIPLLTTISQDVSVGIAVSIALLDRELQHNLEPGTPSPQARLELVHRLREAGLSCGVFVAPVLPELTDSVEQLDGLLAEIAAAGATGVTVLPLHLRPGTREWFAAWLKREHPQLVDSYRSLYSRGSYVDRRYRRMLAERVGPLVRRHGLDPRAGKRTETAQSDEKGTWPSGSLPVGAPEDAPTHESQLTLL